VVDNILNLALSNEAFEAQDRQGSDGMVAAPHAFDPNADEKTRDRIFARDNHTCNFCGFQSKKFQLVLDRSKTELAKQDNKIAALTGDDALVTSCIFCHQCFHLEKVADMKSGTLIWMPELTQPQLHHLARSIYVARITQGPMADMARRTLEMIMKRREEAIERVKTDDPRILSLVLKDYIPRKAYDARHKKLDGIRLFPLDRRTVKEGDLEFNQFPQILAYWRSKDGPFAALNPNDWINHYAQLKAA
jgi:intracellular multiplication protein IcmJ